jgi:hypothetical protein
MNASYQTGENFMKMMLIVTLITTISAFTAQANDYRCLGHGNERDQVRAAIELALREFSNSGKTCRVLSNSDRPSRVNTTFNSSSISSNINEVIMYGARICLNAAGQPIISVDYDNTSYLITSSADQRSIVSIDVNDGRMVTVNNGTLINPQMAQVLQVYAQTKCE